MSRALSSLALVGLLACGVVSEVDYTGRTCKSPCPSGWTCAAGICGRTPAQCSSTAGPSAIYAAGSCIDTTEVTNDQYARFLATTNDGGVDSRLVGPGCQFKTSFLRGSPPPSDAGAGASFDASSYPVNFVDWCDAWAFCAWAGKRLCGRVGGGSLGPADLSNPAVDEWYSACSQQGASNYPYPGPFNTGACNGPEHDAGGPVAVASLPGCQGGYAGLFDMVGNVDEWVDSCIPSADGGQEQDLCTRRSGSYEDPAGDMQVCGLQRGLARNRTDADLGFRCCSSR